MSGHIESFKVAATLASQRIVAIGISGTADTVMYPSSTGTPLIGITVDTVLDTTAGIPVQVNGIAKLLFNDTVTCGTLVTCDTSGRGVPYVFGSASTSSAFYIGILVGPSVADTGTISDVLINPGRCAGA